MRVDGRAEMTEPDTKAGGLEAILAALHEQRFALRMAARDPSPWSDDPAVQERVGNRLGWTRGTGEADELIDAWMAFADEVRGDGIRDIVLLGMGGSSLCPLVASRSLAAADGFPRLRVLDSVDPAAVTRVEEKLDPLTTLFIVASKSGGTIETLTLYRHFRDWLEREDAPAPGSRFVAVTDPGSPLVGIAEQEGFRRVFEAPPDVGGRYSALTVFGLLPMCLMGASVREVMRWAGEMERECAPGLPEWANPAVRLGASLGLLAENGRDKLDLSATRSVEAFPLWIEQLIAESTGKQGTGIVPLAGGAIPQPHEGADDRVFVHYSVTDDEDPAGPVLEALAREGHPVFHIRIPDPEALGGEFLRWEIATATAGALLGVNPFNEPDVAAAKQATASLLEERAAAGRFPEANVIASEGGVAVLDDGSGDAGPAIERSLADAIRRWLRTESDPPYIAVLGYFEETPGRGERIERLRQSIERATGTPTTFGYGPRYLHSTGQLHKGGPAGGLYLVLTADPAEDPPAPADEPTLGTLLRAQALGDVRTLRERGRSVLHANLGWYVDDGLDTIVDAIETA
jgi:glucose-6-phosphate isomerase